MPVTYEAEAPARNATTAPNSSGGGSVSRIVADMPTPCRAQLVEVLEAFNEAGGEPPGGRAPRRLALTLSRWHRENAWRSGKRRRPTAARAVGRRTLGKQRPCRSVVAVATVRPVVVAVAPVVFVPVVRNRAGDLFDHRSASSIRQ